MGNLQLEDSEGTPERCPKQQGGLVCRAFREGRALLTPRLPLPATCYSSQEWANQQVHFLARTSQKQALQLWKAQFWGEPGAGEVTRANCGGAVALTGIRAIWTAGLCLKMNCVQCWPHRDLNCLFFSEPFSACNEKTNSRRRLGLTTQRVTDLEGAPWEVLASLSVLSEGLSVMTATLPLHSKRLKATFKPHRTAGSVSTAHVWN